MAKRCRKVKHRSRSDAMAARRRIGNVSLDAYFCPSCSAWHLGKTRSPYRRAQRIDDLLAAAGFKRET